MELQRKENKPKKTHEPETFVTAEEDDFPTRRALEELNEETRKHYVTKHGAGTQKEADHSPAYGPMDHEA